MLKKIVCKDFIVRIVIIFLCLFITGKGVLAEDQTIPTPPLCVNPSNDSNIKFAFRTDNIVDLNNYNGFGLKLDAIRIPDSGSRCVVRYIKIEVTKSPNELDYYINPPVKLPAGNYEFILYGSRNLAQRFTGIKLSANPENNPLDCTLGTASNDCGELKDPAKREARILLSGDANQDGVINLIDFEMYRQFDNNADFNYNGRIDFDESENGDFRLLTKNFGAKSFAVFTPNPVPTNPPLPRPSPTAATTPTTPPSTSKTPVPPQSCIVHPDVSACFTSNTPPGSGQANCNSQCGKDGKGFECVYTICKTGGQKNIDSGYHCCINKPLPDHPSPFPGSCDTACYMKDTCNNKCEAAGYGKTCIQKTTAICGWEGWQCCPNLTPAATATKVPTPTGPKNTPIPRPTIDPSITPATACTPGYPQAFCAYYLSSCEAHCTGDDKHCIPVVDNICKYPEIYYKCCMK